MAEREVLRGYNKAANQAAGILVGDSLEAAVAEREVRRRCDRAESRARGILTAQAAEEYVLRLCNVVIVLVSRCLSTQNFLSDLPVYRTATTLHSCRHRLVGASFRPARLPTTVSPMTIRTTSARTAATRPLTVTLSSVVKTRESRTRNRSVKTTFTAVSTVRGRCTKVSQCWGLPATTTTELPPTKKSRSITT